MSLDPTSARRRRKFSPLVESLTVRARNALHAVGVDLYTATREDVQAGALRALESHVRGCGETTRMELIALRKRLASSEETQFWAVTVSRNGEDVVTIASTHLSGLAKLSDEDKRVIRLAADRLFSLVGPAEGWSPFIVTDDEPDSNTSMTKRGNP
jgi:hypothetical protein